MSALRPSTYEELKLQSNDQERTVDLRLGTISVDYYEDIFSPSITAKVRVVNTGYSISPKDTNEPSKTDGPKQSIYNGLPLRGGERLVLKIRDRGNSYGGEEKEGIDFASDPSKYLYVSSITDVISDTQKETFLLNLVSREAITNETARVYAKYSKDSKINNSVDLILKNILQTDRIGTIEETKNQYGFIGNLRKPFSVLIWLASKSVPSTSSTAGFVFYQTQDGFQFRSIESLIKQESKATYKYTEINESSISRNNDFLISKYNVDKNQNLVQNLRLGAYSSQGFFFNPNTFEVTAPIFKMKDGAIENLGNDIEFPKISDKSGKELDDVPTRVISAIIDVGTMDKNVTTEKNADPTDYQSQAITRYNLLLTQSVSMTVPCNTDLRAGDVITCEFPKISVEDKDEIDSETSGKYIIKELCHHFDPKSSYTSMKLVRDTFGYYGK